MDNSAVAILNTKLQQLLTEQRQMNDKFQKEIDELQLAIETLGGEVFFNKGTEDKFDDEDPNQIKASLEEI